MHQARVSASIAALLTAATALAARYTAPAGDVTGAATFGFPRSTALRERLRADHLAAEAGEFLAAVFRNELLPAARTCLPLYLYADDFLLVCTLKWLIVRWTSLLLLHSGHSAMRLSCSFMLM